MMRILLLFIFSLVLTPCFSQDSLDVKMEKQLVELLLQDQAAMDSVVDKMLQNAYSLKSANAELNQKYEALNQVKRSWLSTFVIGVNLYSQSTSFDEVNNTSVTTAGVLPNLGVSLSLSPEKLVNIRSNIRIAKGDIARSENTLKELRRSLKLFIIEKYYEYLEALNILEFRFNTYQAQLEQAEQTRLKFVRGEAVLNELIMAQNGLANTEESLLKAKVFVFKLKQQLALYTTDSESN